MSIYAYAVIDSAAVIAPVPGLLGAPVYNVPYRRIGVVVSDLPEGNSPRMGIVPKTLRTAGRALEHSAVADSLMADFTVLPIRFGAVFRERDDVIAEAEENYAGYCANLNRLRAKLEFGLRVIWSGEAIRHRLEGLECNTSSCCIPRNAAVHCTPTAAREFLHEKLVRYRRDQAFAARAEPEIAAIDDTLRRFVAEKRYERLRTPNLLLSAYYLVEKTLLGDFRAACERLRHARPDFKYLLSGPWPPYNFIVMPPRRESHPQTTPTSTDFGQRKSVRLVDS